MRTGDRAGERCSFVAWQGATSEQGKVVLRLSGLGNAPEASRSVARAIEATAADEQVHQLQLRGVTCNHDDCGQVQSAHDGHDAGRRIGLVAASAVGSSEQMLCLSGRRRWSSPTARWWVYGEQGE